DHEGDDRHLQEAANEVCGHSKLPLWCGGPGGRAPTFSGRGTKGASGVEPGARDIHGATRAQPDEAVYLLGDAREGGSFDEPHLVGVVVIQLDDLVVDGLPGFLVELG